MDWDLKTWADPTTLKRASAMSQKGAVGVRQVSGSPGALTIQARVDDGMGMAQPTLRWDGRQPASVCDCPRVQPCVHAVALALAYLADPQPQTEPEAPLAAGALRPGTEVIAYQINLAPPPKKLERRFNRPMVAWLALEKAVVMQDGLPGMPRQLALWAPIPGSLATPIDRAVLELIVPWFQEAGRDFSSAHAHGVPLLEGMVDEVFRALSRAPFVFTGGRNPVELRPEAPIQAISGTFEPRWAIDGEIVPGQNNRLIGDDPPWAFLGDAFRPVVQAPAGEGVAELPAEPEQVAEEHEAVAPVPRLTLTEDGDRLVGRLTFRYGTAPPVAPGDPRERVAGELDGVWGAWRRDQEAERLWLGKLEGSQLEARGQGLYLAWGEPALRFLLDEVPLLALEGLEVYGEERLARWRVHRGAPRVRVAVQSGIDWFDVTTTVELDGQAVPWSALKDAFKQGTRFVKLASGAFARLPEAWLARQAELTGALGLAAEEAPEGFTQRLPRYLAPAARELLDAADEGTTDRDWAGFLSGLEAIDPTVEAPAPEGFIGTLRPYQGHGLARLGWWRDHGLHGILADDMGLGKTIQAIALLLQPEDGPKAPSLLVAPTSVVHNWQAEIAKFAPHMKVLVLHGPQRHRLADAIAESDVVVTSFGLLQRDFNTLKKHHFRYLILDEAQKIKNPRSQAARHACRLTARHRLCLTGTPIENHLIELWSLFHFLMPGLLGSERAFKRLAAGADPEEEPAARERLRRLTRPFVLRRLKQEVATDLPPRTEIVSYCELNDEQRALYRQTLDAVRGSIFGEVREKGLQRSRFHVLEGLLRLRQVACDPRLVLADPESAPPSAKLEHFMELLKEMIEGGHRVLVFSQFVKMLSLLKPALEAEGIEYAYLDGQTKDRLERVQAFNAGTTPVFLISLKAGGTGLNLTGADYVVHFDPWWNPAVEDQATDRAHRIGQTRHVFSYKLIAKDTIEEKVLALQESKRKLVADVLDAGLDQAFTEEDLAFLLEV